MEEEVNYWQRTARRRLSRRTAIRGAAAGLAGLAGAALVGCAEDEEGTPTPTAPAAGTPGASPSPQAQEPKRGGVYRGGFTGPFAGVDPHNSVYGGSGIVPQVYNYLFRKEVLRPNVGLLRDLAVSHELQDDQVTWVFQLRPDATVAPNSAGIDERPLDAEDVVANWDRVSNPQAAANGFAFFARWVESYDAPDPQTVRLITKRPYAWVEEVLGDNLQGPIAPHEWLESDQLKAMAVGAGPFMLRELSEGQRAVMVPNPNFYDSELPYLDEYHILAFSDLATQRTAFTTRQVDVYSAADIEEAKQLEQQVSGVLRYEDPSTAYKSFWMRTDVPPWDDERVRRAMNFSMNREQYIQVIGKGQGTPLGPISDVFVDYALPSEELEQYQPAQGDPEEAASLFSAASVSEISFAHPTSSNMNDFVNVMAQQLQQVGVTARPEPMDAGAWVAAYFTSQLTASYSLNQSYKTPDFALQWYHTGGITGNNNYDTKFSVPEIDAAIDAAAETLDEDERIEAYRDAQRLIFEHDPAFINVYHQYGNVVVYDNVKNFSHGPGGIDNAFVRTYWLDS